MRKHNALSMARGEGGTRKRQRSTAEADEQPAVDAGAPAPDAEGDEAGNRVTARAAGWAAAARRRGAPCCPATPCGSSPSPRHARHHGPLCMRQWTGCMACRRAAHFANYAPDDENDGKDGDNPHVGSGKVRAACKFAAGLQQRHRNHPQHHATSNKQDVTAVAYTCVHACQATHSRV